MVDIDAERHHNFQKIFAGIRCRSFRDKRSKVYNTDARKWLAESKEKFDVIIMTDGAGGKRAVICCIPRNFTDCEKQTDRKRRNFGAGRLGASYTELLTSKPLPYTEKHFPHRKYLIKRISRHSAAPGDSQWHR